ncbi:hypothetical protein CVIRNUC_004711 [Coccomyxa viridis]|uniref:CBF1-interacting co-repressor CIR N-terminal domain-containing protein n=1 Tax=Coccomyxa viridis TaxID=1274662 RepID=A0AAV1I3X0_9CHLO|nr:hypothetical protein CVIRNUC_004711 [Coccomyxa viridis]
MGGGGLSFLNKKTWHPARLDRQEDKWKREQAAAKEEQKAEEIKKQIIEEREHEELDALAHAAGIKQRSDKLDWMYQGGMVAKAEANKRVEEQQQQQQQQQASQPVLAAEPGGPGSAAVKLPTFYAEDTAASANEVWSRLHSDPLFAIKQQEIAARRTIASNPVQMDAIRKQVEQRKAAEEEAKAAKKAGKRAKKDARRAEKAERKAQKHAASGKAQKHEEAEDGHKNKKCRHSSDSGRRARDAAKEPHNAHENGSRHANGHDKHMNADAARPLVDGACAQRGDIRYGLNISGDAPDEAERRERRAATQRNLEEAAKRKADEEREKAAQRYVRKEYKTGQLTAEERAQRLAEMTGNASVHDEARWSRQRRARERDEADEAADERRPADEQKHTSKAAAFLKTATQETYGAGGEAASLADRVGRRKYYSERGGGH